MKRRKKRTREEEEKQRERGEREKILNVRRDEKGLNAIAIERYCYIGDRGHAQLDDCCLATNDSSDSIEGSR